MKKLLFIPLLFGLSFCTQKAKETIGSTANTEAENQHSESTSDSLVVKANNQYMEIAPAIGGRIVSLKMDGQNFLTGKAINADNWGSTFWTSPQQAWGWPPSEEIDKKPYKVTFNGDTPVLTSEKDSKLGFVIKKEISGNAEDTSFTITYSITNESDSAQKVAPWEISRVHPGGLTFYPSGAGAKKGDLASLTQDVNGITWFNYESEKIPGGVPKLLADGAEGWLAQVNDGRILIKKFPNVAQEKIAPGEGEIEMYTNPDKSYVEIEQQGAYETLNPGATVTWEVHWFLRTLPKSVKVEVGSKSLLSYARSVVEGK